MRIQGRVSRRKSLSVSLTALAMALSLTACNRASGGDDKLIVAHIFFPCSLNDFAAELCAGLEEAEKNLPDGYSLQVKAATEMSDTTAYNNQIQTSMQLNPAGMIVFPFGPTAQVPVLKDVCAENIEIMILDNAVEGLDDCVGQTIEADNRQLGVDIGKWLLEHPPESKEVAIVSLPPGSAASNEARIEGFKATIEPEGYKVVSEVSTDFNLDETRSKVQNVITAHPNLGAIFSVIDSFGDATSQAVGDRDILQLSVDGALTSVERIPSGGLDADAAQAPYWLGRTSVENMVKLLKGEDLEARIFEPRLLVDKTNVEEYLADGGLR